MRKRKEVLYFDMEKIERNNEPLCESEQEVARRACFNPKSSLLLRLDLEAALQELPPRQRQAIELTVAGHTEEEIARLMGISHQTVSRLLAKARRALKKFLEGGCKTAPKCP